MNRKRAKRVSGERGTGCGTCWCQGLGPALTEFFRRVGPPNAARRHFEAARVEMLKGLRAILDARIEQVTGTQVKGEKIKVD